MLDISYQANTFHISHHGRPIGKIHSYQNPYHQVNTYLRLDLVDYDCTIAKQLFQSLQTFLEGKPLQIMLSSADYALLCRAGKNPFPYRSWLCLQAEML
ncbi:hypothetical protein [Streptococcus suis]|uniref:hypothetical protein n=1 Tax=Streptococcus suis TaxID=1307 RepID=UPI00041EE370